MVQKFSLLEEDRGLAEQMVVLSSRSVDGAHQSISGFSSLPHPARSYGLQLCHRDLVFFFDDDDDDLVTQ